MNKHLGKIFVLGVEYNIYIDESVKEAGETNFMRYTINLSPEISGKYFESTLWHELSHAYQHEAGLVDILPSKVQEMVAQTMSSFIMNTVIPMIESRPRKRT